MKERCTMDEAEHIVNTYADMVYKFALSLTRNKDQADDVFQNVFLRYSKTLPVFENEEHTKAWFFYCHKELLSQLFNHSLSKASCAFRSGYSSRKKRRKCFVLLCDETTDKLSYGDSFILL